MAEGKYYYQFQVGTAYWARWGLDDRSARRLLARWLRLAWPRFVERCAAEHPGSIAHATNTGWYNERPRAVITRTWVEAPAYVIPAIRPTVVESFWVSLHTIEEFSRIYDPRKKGYTRCKYPRM